MADRQPPARQPAWRALGIFREGAARYRRADQIKTVASLTRARRQRHVASACAV